MKNSAVRITEETERAVIDKAWRDHRIRSWQGAMDLAIRQFLEEVPATGAPAGTRAIYVPAELPDDLAGSSSARAARW